MSCTCNYLHIVFGTKYRKNTILIDRRERLYQYITQIIKNKKSELLKINGIGNHVHILLNLHPTIALAEMMKNIKQSSSKMITERYLFPDWEGWASEYYACSVSPSHLPPVKEYISNQEYHHGIKDFVEEMNDFVGKMGMTLYRDEP